MALVWAFFIATGPLFDEPMTELMLREELFGGLRPPIPFGGG